MIIFIGPSNNNEKMNNNIIDEDYQADNPYPYAGVEPYDEHHQSTYERGNRKIKEWL